ncbi:hypothetical protein BYT27DRAFT_7275931 [Phlegmacium glaucopus]|nr:hypothetical protein BYT27DRAFT_7275931 [Phlegmacium glaucopus]
MTEPNAKVKVSIRIEGRTKTIFEGTVETQGRTVTTNTGTIATGPADGTNGNEYPFSVPTCTSALADIATGTGGRPKWGGTFNDEFQDFFIDTIDEKADSDAGEFWQLVLNFSPTPLGGGQMRVTTGDSVLWALITVPQGLGFLRQGSWICQGQREVQSHRY